MARSEDASSQSTSTGEKIWVRFATNRNQTGDDSLFGSTFRSVPPLFVTGTIDVYHQGGNPIPNWVPDPKACRSTRHRKRQHYQFRRQ